MHELQIYPNSIFVTLTFDEISLSRFVGNPNKSLSLFLDRVRKKYGKQVRHWFVAEFGSKRGRLHYHGILFDIDINNDELHSLWKYGHTFVGYANEATAKYIVKYLTKQDTKGVLPPRIVSSKGIGSSWLDSPSAQLAYKSCSYMADFGGMMMPIPRYYIDKLYSDDERMRMTYYYYMETPPQNEWYLNGRRYTDFTQYEYHRVQLLKQYKSYGLLFDDYLKRPIISRETLYKELLYLSSKYSEFDY